MSDLPDRALRAFRDHDAFDAAADAAATETDAADVTAEHGAEEAVEETDAAARFAATSTPFDGVVTAEPGDGGEISYSVTVRVPMLDEVTEGEVAPVVEEGWYETFERRIGSIGGGIIPGDHTPDPAVETGIHDGARVAEVVATFEDTDPRRGVNDAAAIVDFVEGTYVQGVIPGYDYTDPVAGILAEARRAGGSDGVSQ